MPTNSAQRSKSIGGSDIAAILGVDPKRDAFQLWLEKTGRMPVQQTDRMVLGKCLEQGIVKYYEYQTGYQTTWIDVTHYHRIRTWQSFTVDAVVRGMRKGVDAKLVSLDQRHEWGPTINEIPQSALYQAIWYTNAMDYDSWDIAALIGDKLYVYTVTRDRELEEALLGHAQHFFERYLIGDEEPPMGTTETTRLWLSRQFPKNGATIREATEEEIELMCEYGLVRSRQKKLDTVRTGLENQLKSVIGDDAGIKSKDYTFTWKKIKDSIDTHWTKIGNHSQPSPDEQELLNKYATKDGYRRIWFQSDVEVGE